MYAGQRMVAPDGYEVALFPLPYLYMSQDEGGDYSHQGTYNIDLLGWSSSGRVYNAPLYAPCTMKVVATYMNYGEAGGHAVFFESVNKVHLANGSLDYLTLMVGHDPNPPYTTIGQVVTQGDVCYHTGTYGYVTGDHCHTCCGQGHYQGTTDRPPYNHEDLTNRIHYWDALFVNDTTIVQGYNQNWITYIPPTPPPVVDESKFPWYIYFRKRRDLLK
jgi:hypothetical protein